MLRNTPLCAAAAGLTMALAIVPSNAVAQDDALTIYSGGIDAMLVDPKDRSLLQMLHLIDDRILDLPEEVDEPDMPAPIISMVINALMSPMSLRGGVLPEIDPREGPPFYLQLDVAPNDEATVKRLAGDVHGLFNAFAPAPSTALPDHPSLHVIDADGTPVFHGVSHFADGPAFTLAINRLSHDAVHPSADGLPDGVAPVLGFELDIRKLQPLIHRLLEEAPPGEADAIRSQLEMLGLAGPDTGVISWVAGHGKDRTYHLGRFANYGKSLREMGLVSSERLTAQSLKRIPADATYAQITRVDISGYDDMLRKMLENIPASPFEDEQDVSPYDMMNDMFRGMTGLDLATDILDHFGDEIAGYTSESTGGGGLLSAAWFVEVENPEALQKSLNALCDQANQIAAHEANGYVRFQRGHLDGHDITVLTFPGLPVPIEFSMSIADGYLYAAPTPAGLRAAIEQGRGGKPGLADHPRFREMGGNNLSGAMQLTFVDTPVLARDGYSLVSMGMSALSNAVRSPGDPHRGIALGTTMPSFNEVMKDAKATLEVVRYDGDDIVITAQTDRSLVVNACGMVGMIGGSAAPVLVAALGAGVMMPALAKARENAEAMKSATQLREVSMGVMMFAAEHDDHTPPSISRLVEAGYLSADVISSPYGPSWDDHGDYWIDSDRKMASVRMPDMQILAYDRAMYGSASVVAVAFYDGHVQMLGFEEFHELMSMDHHKGIDFRLPF